MQTHLYFWCAGIFFLATCSLENCKQFWSQSRSSVDGSDGSRCSFHNSPWWFFEGFHHHPVIPHLQRFQLTTNQWGGSNQRPKQYFFQAWKRCQGTNPSSCFDVAEVCVVQHKSRLAEPRNHPETWWWIWRLFEGPCQVECWFLPGVPQKRCWRKWANLGSQPKNNIKQTSSNYRLYIGLPPCPVIVTTRICAFFLVGDSFASFATVAGKGA